jgi:hypothetical protein
MWRHIHGEPNTTCREQDGWLYAATLRGDVNDHEWLTIKFVPLLATQKSKKVNRLHEIGEGFADPILGRRPVTKIAIR